MMRKLLVIILFLCGVASGVNAESVSLVKISDFDNIISYKIMTSAEIREESKAISAENRKYTAALRIAKETWKKDPEVAKKPFPQSRFKKKALSRVRSFTKKEQADEALTNAQASAEKSNAELNQPSSTKEDDKDKSGGKKKKASPAEAKKAAQRKKWAEENFALETKAIEMFKNAMSSL
ncbi:hypothetical protein ACFLS1_07830 [Verrucomicrobiota bacterium]